MIIRTDPVIHRKTGDKKSALPRCQRCIRCIFTTVVTGTVIGYDLGVTAAVTQVPVPMAMVNFYYS